jgi:TetR/AcrR family transcriptional regulator, transcriptional repressor for nem operon
MASKGELTRAKIVDQATQVFHRKGFLSTTINDLLAATGTTKGNLYFHFSSKEEVAAEVLRQAHERFRTFLATSLQGPTPGARLDNFFRQALERNRSKGFVGGCLFGNTALETSDTAPQLAAVAAEVFAEWIGTLQETIAAAQTTGEVRRDLPAADLAGLVVSSLEGAIMLSRLHKREEPLVVVLETLRSLLALKVAGRRYEPDMLAGVPMGNKDE